MIMHSGDTTSTSTVINSLGHAAESSGQQTPIQETLAIPESWFLCLTIELSGGIYLNYC